MSDVAHVEETPHHDELGRLLMEVRPENAHPVLVWLLVLFLFAVAIFFALGAAATIPEPISLFFAAISLGIFLLAYLVISDRWANLRVYERGLVAHQGLLSEITLPFDEIQEIRTPRFWPVGMVDPLCRSKLVGHGRKIKATGLPPYPVRNAMNMVLQHVLPRLGKELLDIIDAGGEVKFGSLHFGTDGLSYGKVHIALADVERGDFSPEGFRIYPRGRPTDVIVLPLKTPNLHVLIWLCNSINERTRANAMQPATATAASSDAHKPTVATEPASVLGFAQHDAMLGAIICGKPRRPGVVRFFSQLSAVGFFGGLTCLTMRGLPWSAPCAAVGGVIGTFSLLFSVLVRKEGLAIYEHGLQTTWHGLRYDEIEHMSYQVTDQYVNGAYSGRHLVLTLEAPRATIKLSGTGARDEGYHSAIVERLVPLLAERRYQEVKRGLPLTVSNTTLTHDGITVRRLAVPLAEVSGSNAHQGYYFLWRRGQDKPFLSLPAGKSDARIFWAVVHRLLAERAAKPAG
jgi:hypothetical protein